MDWVMGPDRDTGVTDIQRAMGSMYLGDLAVDRPSSHHAYHPMILPIRHSIFGIS